MSDKIRTFIAVDTPPEFKVRAEEIQKQLNTGTIPVRWEKSYKLHLTLKFLGATEPDLLGRVESALDEIAFQHKPFWLHYEGLGCFPNSKSPRIIWIGCKPLSPDLEHLQQIIENKMSELGYENESRAFHPHITIGRVKTGSGKERRTIQDLIKKMESITFDSLEDEVQSILLMKSELRRDGSVYSILKQFPLSS